MAHDRPEGRRDMVADAHVRQGDPPPSITLLKGSEDALVQRALRSVRDQVLHAAPDAEEAALSAATYEAGELAMAASGSLFASEKILTITDLDQMTDDFADDFLQFLNAHPDGVWAIAHHRGGNRGLRVTKAIAAAGYPVIDCQPIKNVRAKIDLVIEEVRRQSASIDRVAAEALVAALGDELGELLASARQLAFDSGGRISAEDVHTFHRGRVETKPWDVADAVADRDPTRALLLTRQAFATQVAPVVIVSALATKFRLMASTQVPGLSDSDIKGHPFQIRNARQQARRWNEEALGAAILAIARADAAVKGQSRVPEGAVEACIVDIARSS